MIKTLSYLFSLVTVTFVSFLIIKLILDGSGYVFSGEFLRNEYWDYHSETFNATSMIFGTFAVSVIALGIALPLGIGAAIFISEHLKGKFRAVVKITVELLSGVPSVVYGLIGVMVLMPLLSGTILQLGGETSDSIFTAGVLLSIMILPTIITFSDDALRCVPKTVREEGLGLGFSKFQVIWLLVIPQAKKGLIAAAMLAWGRAIGETIAVFLVVGRSDRPISFDGLEWSQFFLPGQTLTSKLGGSELAIAYGDSIHWGAMMGLGLLLWFIVGAVSYFTEYTVGERT